MTSSDISGRTWQNLADSSVITRVNFICVYAEFAAACDVNLLNLVEQQHHPRRDESFRQLLG